MSKRDQYVAKMKLQIDETNLQLDKLAAKIDGTKSNMQIKYKQEMADLRAQSAKANAKLDEMKAASEDSWDGMIAEMDKIGKAFKHSYNYFKSQL